MGELFAEPLEGRAKIVVPACLPDVAHARLKIQCSFFLARKAVKLCRRDVRPRDDFGRFSRACDLASRPLKGRGRNRWLVILGVDVHIQLKTLGR